MVFTKEDYEIYNNTILQYDRIQYESYMKKLSEKDSTAPIQTIIYMRMFSENALKHKELILKNSLEMQKIQVELIKAYLSIVEAGAGNISPAGNLSALLTVVLNFVQIGALLTTLGDMQGDFMSYLDKPLLAYISEPLQQTEGITQNNLSSAYTTIQEAVILPDKLLR